jgi:IPT/TIG domain
MVLDTLLSGHSHLIADVVHHALTRSDSTTACGTSVILTRENFVAGATVSFGGAAAVVTSVNATTIEARTPARKPGSVNGVVTNPDGQSSTLSSGFAFRKHRSLVLA